MSGGAPWQIVIEKQLGSEYWVNDYYVLAASLTAAAIEGYKIVDAEKDIHRNVVTFTKMRVKLVDDLGQGTVYPLSGTGVQPISTYLSLFNVVRVDFSPAAGRPGRKYIRMPIPTGGVENGIIVASVRTAVQDDYVTPLLAMGTLCKSTGVPLVSGAVIAQCGMHQLRRGSKRRTQPII